MAAHDPCSANDDGLFAALDVFVVMACRDQGVRCGLLGGEGGGLEHKCKQERTKVVALSHPRKL